MVVKYLRIALCTKGTNTVFSVSSSSSSSFVFLLQKLCSLLKRKPVFFLPFSSDRRYIPPSICSPRSGSANAMAASPITFFNFHRSPYLHSSASSSSLSSSSSSSSSSSLDSFIFARSSNYNSTSRNFLGRSTLSYCKSSSYGNLSWIYGRRYSKGPEKSAGVRDTIEIQANLSSSTPPSASSSSYSSYTFEDESKFSDIKIVKHGNAVLEDIPHLTDWLPDLPTYNSPLTYNPVFDSGRYYFVGPDDVVAKNVVLSPSNQGEAMQRYFRRAGPRGKVYFKPGEVRACIVTCGGLCPGLNTVIREIVCGLWNQYGVQDILGIEGGYRGFYARNTVRLTPKTVNDIHKRGGTVLGTSRGGHDTTKIVNSIEDRGINQVYIIGGDGTQKGAAAIYKEVRKRGLKVNIVGIPKTIDNDIAIIDRSFGFDTAVEEAQRAINAAHTEAESTHNGIGLVKLMGRHSGYIAMFATLASRDVDLCLIPEVPFYLEGKGGLYEFVERRLRENGHMVIVVAEGAGQELLKTSGQESARDESGNQVLLDVGLWLSQKLKDYFISTKKGSLNLKYIDPTYMIRAIPSNASDNVYCTLLAQSGIHGAMAGYTGFTVAPVNGRHAYIPISRVTEKQNRVNVYDRMWARLLSTTNQPAFIDAEKDDEETPVPSSASSPQLTPPVHQESGNGTVITEMELDTMVNVE